MPLSNYEPSKLSIAEADRRACDLVVIDVDGTLLTSQNTLSAELPPLVAQAQARGIGVTLASGRPQSTMRPILASLGLTLPYISAGGALMVDPATQRVLYACPLSREQMALCIEQARIAGAAVVAQTPEQLYYEGDQATWEQFASISSIDVTGADRSKALMTGVPDVLLACAEPMKVTICADPGTLLAVEQALQRFPALLHLTYSAPIYLEITRSEASKGEAVKRLASHLGIALDRILAIGDSTHDLSMLEVVGTAVAVENAPEEVKAVAHFVAPSNDEEGVAWMLRKLALAAYPTGAGGAPERLRAHDQASS